MAKSKISTGTKIATAILIIIVLVISYFFAKCKYEDYQLDKYGGHNFDYMNGKSSTDFTGYHVYDGEKLVKPSTKPPFIIEDEKDMPVLDGAEACYPVYTALAKTLYKDIDKIEKAAYDEFEKWNEKDPPDYDKEKDWYGYNGKIVGFSNTEFGYSRLTDGEVDMFFGARPSAEDKEIAAEEKKTIISTPIGTEAFVFFVEKDNPVDSLTADQIRQIYSGKITNWKEVGGKDEKIVAFQRPEESGSQVMMKYFMGDVKLKKPDTYEYEAAMGGVLEEVKQYNNEAGAMGYTFRYFLEGLQQEKGVKILAIDGIAPTQENIANKKYPVIVPLVCATIEGNKNPYVDKILDYLRSEGGQEIITKTGYGPLDKDKKDPIKEN